MDQSSTTSVGQWISLILFWVIFAIVLLAPLAPFVGMIVIIRKHPYLWEAFWRNPWKNGLLLVLVLSIVRVAFIASLSLLIYVSPIAIYAAAYAWYPELLFSDLLYNCGWSPLTPNGTSSLIFLLQIFAINVLYWLGVLPLAILGRWLKHRGR